jgi:hypothetical protein
MSLERTMAILVGLQADMEFRDRLGLSTSSPDVLVRYLTARGVDLTDAQLLSMAYFVGGDHALARVGHLMSRAQVKT